MFFSDPTGSVASHDLTAVSIGLAGFGFGGLSNVEETCGIYRFGIVI
jgi:hypothetical protein